MSKLQALAPTITRYALRRFVSRTRPNEPILRITVHSNDPAFLQAMERLIETATSSSAIATYIDHS